MIVRLARGGLVIAVGAALVTGCGTHPHRTAPGHPPPGQTLGRFPVATAAATGRQPIRATPGHPGIAVMGDTVDAALPASAAVAVTALGPTFHLPQNIPAAVRGVITVSMVGVRGVHAVRASDFYAVDEKHRRVALTPGDLRAAAAHANPTASTSVARGQRVTFTLTGTFQAGNASLVWTPGGVAMGVWEFTTEYD
ncbi:MAG TPA: hypothetical protein VFC16_03455 [Nakamurella sp.]|nr:hypothetical protein [Nakamurella sp.]